MSKSPFVALCLLILVFGLGSLVPGSNEPRVVAGGETALEHAERLFAEGSYGLALERYEALDPNELTDAEARWVEFRLADCAWRTNAATRSSDTTKLDRARERLKELLRRAARTEEHDLAWAETAESLGDFWWTRRNSRNWHQAWNYYRQALDWWAGSREIETARARYLDIVWKTALPPRPEPYYYYGYHGNQLPLDVLDNALSIAERPEDQAHAQYLIAMTLRNQGGDERAHRRTEEAFVQALEAGRATDWHDDALFHYAEWVAGRGLWVRSPQGARTEPDHVRAVELYERLLREYDKGETRYYDQAENRVRNITAPSLGIAVSNVFLPGSEIQYHLNWRNVAEVELRLYPIDLVRQVAFGQNDDRSNWLAKLDVRDADAAASWTYSTLDPGRHMPGQQSLTLEDSPATGAYVLEATGGGQTTRDLVLITRATAVLQMSPSQALVYICDALDGSPLAGAEIALWVVDNNHSPRIWKRIDARTDDDGLAVVELPADQGSWQLFVAAGHGEDQAFALGQNWHSRPDADGWRIYVFTDRPAYRPNEEVQWKMIARRVDPRGEYGERYGTPAEQTVQYEINDPRGAKIDEGELRLNRFGSAWDTLALGEELPLGEYRVTFRDAGRHIGGATLFRMEEYKLPEFEVSIETARDDAGPRTYRLGETVEADVVAGYYFGGAVADATVNVVVYQKPLHVRWRAPRPFPWFYGDMDRAGDRGWYGQGQVVHQETLQTDAEGRATVRFDTPADSAQDLEYTVEARVTDASRREVVGRGSVRVSRQRYFAFVRATHNLYRPGDDVRIEIRTTDANDRPFEAEGLIKITRDSWVEKWLDPGGREVSGEAPVTARGSGPLSAPPGRPGDPGWQLKSRGYEREEILSRLVRTGEDGTAEIEFSPHEDGYYRIEWSGDNTERFPVRAETTVWVADRDSRQIGYHHGGVQILVDSDTLRAGRTAPVMLNVPVSDSYVLFTVEAEDLIDYRLVHVTGTVKLLELDVSAAWVPNVFLSAVLVRDGEMLVDGRQVVVPPVDQFLEIEIEADRESYEPGERGTFDVTTYDHDGNPVAAEVALALVDKSILYIQQDYAGDPRQFYFGSKRPKRVQLQSTFQQKPYGKLVRDEKGELAWRRTELTFDRDAVVEKEGDEFRQDAMKSEGFAGRSRAKKSVGGVADAAMAPQAMMMAEGEATMPSDTGAGAGPVVQVRSDFRSTALWLPDLVTGQDGHGRVEVTFPDSLTTWQATARAGTAGSRFGIGDASVRTRKPLIARLQAPRFFVVGDEVTVSAVINNNTETALTVEVALDAAGVNPIGLLRDGKASSDLDARVEVPASGEARVDWLVEVSESGEARLQVVARSDEHADAMERSYVVHEHGVEKFVSRSGKMRGDEVQVTLQLPRERRPGSTSLTVQVTPSLAVTMLDALPYLIDYPYGCTEQTMSRFLPAAITARTLAGLGLEPGAIAGRIFGGIEQEHAGSTHTHGKQEMKKLDEMLKVGLRRLYDFQHGDGGWGWWKEGESDHFMTAYVVWGLGIARDAGIEIDRRSLERGAEFLNRELVEEEDNLDLQAWMLHALASKDANLGRGWRTEFQRAAFDNLWDKRDGLNSYSRALLALSAHYADAPEEARVLVRNLVNGVKRDDSPDTSVVSRTAGSTHASVMGTAHWGEDGLYWRWSDGGVEATAFALRALLAIEPDNELVEPVSNWLIKNRRGAQWSNTRDTAITVLTLGEYLRTSGELASDLEYELEVNGRPVATKRVGPGDVLSAPSRFTIDPTWLEDGPNRIRIARSSGDGPLYFAAEAEYFSLEEPITAAGNEIFVRRQYFQLSAQPTLLKGYEYEKQPLSDGERVGSGERVEVVLTIEAKNNYEYLVFEDLKPAGLEAVQLKSGEPIYAKELRQEAASFDEDRREAGDYTGRTRWVYQELRDRKVALFLDRLPEGMWEIRYELRAETPGTFHALPVLGHAMYVPEIRCNGAEVRIEVVD